MAVQCNLKSWDCALDYESRGMMVKNEEGE